GHRAADHSGPVALDEGAAGFACQRLPLPRVPRRQRHPSSAALAAGSGDRDHHRQQSQWRRRRADCRHRRPHRRAISDAIRACSTTEPPPDFTPEAHAPQDPNPWLALYLDRSTPLPEPVKRAWLADTCSPARQYLLPFLRPVARLGIVLVQVLKVFTPR